MNKPLKTATLMLIVPALAVWPRIQMPHGATPLYVPLEAAQAQDAPTSPAAADAGLAQRAYAILEKNCTSCHGNGKRLSKAAAIDKDTWDKLVNEQKKITPGRPGESSVYTLMIDHENPMPPKKSQQRPTPEEIEVVKNWIVIGAPNWAFVETAVEPQPVAPIATPTPVPTAVPSKPAIAKPVAAKPALRKSSKPAARRPAKAKSVKSSSKKPVKKPVVKKPVAKKPAR